MCTIRIPMPKGLVFFFFNLKIKNNEESPDSPVVRILCIHCWPQSFIPGWGTKTPQAMWCDQQQQKRTKNKKKSKNIKLIPTLLITGAGRLCPQHRSSGLRLTASL